MNMTTLILGKKLALQKMHALARLQIGTCGPTMAWIWLGHLEVQQSSGIATGDTASESLTAISNKNGSYIPWSVFVSSVLLILGGVFSFLAWAFRQIISETFAGLEVLLAALALVALGREIWIVLGAASGKVYKQVLTRFNNLLVMLACASVLISCAMHWQAAKEQTAQGHVQVVAYTTPNETATIWGSTAWIVTGTCLSFMGFLFMWFQVEGSWVNISDELAKKCSKTYNMRGRAANTTGVDTRLPWFAHINASSINCLERWVSKTRSEPDSAAAQVDFFKDLAQRPSDFQAACRAAKWLGCTSFLDSASDVLFMCLRIRDPDSQHLIKQCFGPGKLDVSEIAKLLAEQKKWEELENLWANENTLEPYEMHWEHLDAVLECVKRSRLFPHFDVQETLTRFQVLPVAIVCRDDRMEVRGNQMSCYLVFPLPKSPRFRAFRAILRVTAGVDAVEPDNHDNYHSVHDSWADMALVDSTNHKMLYQAKSVYANFASDLTEGHACTRQREYVDAPGSLVNAINRFAGSNTQLELRISSPINTHSHFIEYASLQVLFAPIGPGH